MIRPAPGRTEGPTDIPGAVQHGFRTALPWAYAMTGGRMITTLLVSLLLARLLGPTAFGLIAMANVYIFFVEMLVRQGLVAAIIQRPALTREHMDTAFWMITAVIAVLIPASIGLSPFWADINQTPDLQPVILGLSPVLALKGLAVVQEAQMRRRLDYRVLALRTNLAVALGGLAGIVSALMGAGVWALVVQQLVTGTVEVVVLWRVSDWRPSRRFDRVAARELLGFSAFSGVAGLGVFLDQRMDALMIGLFFGPAAAGLYRLAVRLADTLTMAVGGALQSVSLPELSRFTSDQDAFNRRTGEILRLTAVVTVPFFAVLALVARPLLTLLGPDWGPAVIALQVLCLLGVVQVFTNLVGPILQAAGRPGVLALFAWIAAGFSAGGFLVGGMLVRGMGLDAQVGGLAMSRLVAYVLIVGMLALTLPRLLGLRMRTVASALARPCGAALAGFGAASALLASLGPDVAAAPFFALVVYAVTGTLLVGAALLAIDPMSRSLVGRAYAMVTGVWRSRTRSAPDPVEVAGGALEPTTTSPV